MNSNLNFKTHGIEVWNNFIDIDTIKKIVKKTDGFYEKRENLGYAKNFASLTKEEFNTFGASRIEEQKKNFFLKQIIYLKL